MKPSFPQRVLQRFRWFFASGTRLIALLLLVVGLPGVIPGQLGSVFPSGLVRFHTAISAELVGMALAVLLIDTANELRSEREQKEALILQMGSPDNVFAVEAARQLRARGWLEDGSLRGTFLFRANLQGAYLIEANLRGATLLVANLQGAILVVANLQEADLKSANLQKAKLGDANLQGANFEDANLQRADLYGANLRGAKYLKLEQLRQADRLQGATLPDGTQLPDDDSWRSAFEEWCKTVKLDEEGYIVPATPED